MNLEQKIGQLFLIGFHGDIVDQTHPICRDIQDHNLGGVILFDRLLSRGLDHNNIISASQLRKLTSTLQSFADTPLFICVDQEGGSVCRLKKERGFPDTISARELGIQDDLSLTASHAEKTAQMLASVGINFNFAPVVDVNINSDNPVIGKLGRSFSSEPRKVARHARTWINAHRQHNVLSCLKHFPGHGSSQDDSHHGFVSITDTWQEIELSPFQELIKNDFADAIMTGHLFHRNLDDTRPATLSPLLINGILRKKLHFNGLVTSDDLQMKSISNHYSLQEAVCMALSAGVDMIIIGNNLIFDDNVLPKLIKTIMKAVKDNRLPVERILEALDHVQTAKRKIKLLGREG